MNGLYLEELSLNHLEQLNHWRNDKDLIDRLGNNFRYIAKPIDDAWYQQYVASRDKNIRLAIMVDEHYIGNVNLTDIHPINAAAEFSIFIGNKNFRGKGLGKIATQQMLIHGFKNLNLYRIYLTVLKSNTPACALYQKLGFKEEGVHRHAIFKNGEFHDLISMSMLKHECKLI